MPLLIYVVLQANPEHIVSNVQYILRFRNQEKLGGEAGYYLSSLASRVTCTLTTQLLTRLQMGAIQFIENMDRTTLTISDEEFEKNVEAAVSAIAEKHRLESPPTSTTSDHPPMSFPVPGEASNRLSMDNDAAPRRSTSSNDDSGDYDEKAAITGLLRTIQRPLSTIGRMFSDSDDVGGSSSNAARSPAHTPLPPGAEGGPDRRRAGNSGQYAAAEAAARQASAEAAEAQRLSRAEHANIVETLAGMFPDLEKDIISDVVYQKEGRYVTSVFILMYPIPCVMMLTCSLQSRTRRGCVPGFIIIGLDKAAVGGPDQVEDDSTRCTSVSRGSVVIIMMGQGVVLGVGATATHVDCSFQRGVLAFDECSTASETSLTVSKAVVNAVSAETAHTLPYPWVTRVKCGHTSIG